MMSAGSPQSNQPVTVPAQFTLRIVASPYHDAEALALMRALDDELAAIYGSGDREPVDEGGFAPPDGLFLVGYQADRPIACGGFRLRRDVRADKVDAEIKRMFVAEVARKRGYGSLILVALEHEARVSGATRAILETGTRSVAAFAMYQHRGYQVIPPFSLAYADSPTNRGMAKVL